MNATAASTGSETGAEGAVQRHNVSDGRLREATGRTSSEWHRILGDAGARDWDHATVARWLTVEHGVDEWWAQNITVGYEQARGTRLPGQQADGTFSVSASKTLRATKAAALRAIIDTISIELGDPASVSPDVRYARAWWRDGGEKVHVTVSEPRDGSAVVALNRSRMAEPGTARSKEGLLAWLDTAQQALA